MSSRGRFNYLIDFLHINNLRFFPIAKWIYAEKKRGTEKSEVKNQLKNKINVRTADEVRAGCGWSMCGASACARIEVEMVKIRSTMKMQPKKINKIIHYSYVYVRLDEESKTCASLESPIGATLKQCQVNTQNIRVFQMNHIHTNGNQKSIRNIHKTCPCPPLAHTLHPFTSYDFSGMEISFHFTLPIMNAMENEGNLLTLFFF